MADWLLDQYVWRVQPARKTSPYAENWQFLAHVHKQNIQMRSILYIVASPTHFYISFSLIVCFNSRAISCITVIPQIIFGANSPLFLSLSVYVYGVDCGQPHYLAYKWLASFRSSIFCKLRMYSIHVRGMYASLYNVQKRVMSIANISLAGIKKNILM